MEGYKLECFLNREKKKKTKLNQNLGMKEIFKTKKFMLQQDFHFS